MDSYCKDDLEKGIWSRDEERNSYVNGGLDVDNWGIECLCRSLLNVLSCYSGGMFLVGLGIRFLLFCL